MFIRQRTSCCLRSIHFVDLSALARRGLSLPELKVSLRAESGRIIPVLVQFVDAGLVNPDADDDGAGVRV